MSSKSSGGVQDWWHGIVNNKEVKWSTDDYVSAIELCLAEDIRRDLNELDARGTTALYEAVKLESASARVAAIEALLRCGADVNVVDSRGKTALTYLSTTESSEICAIYFLVRINVLAYLELPICEQNRQWYREWHDNVYGAWVYSCDRVVNNDDATPVDEIKRYALYGMVVAESTTEIGALRETRVNDRMTLESVLNDANDELIIRHLDDLRAVVETEDFYDRFVDFGGLIKQRYRKALFTRHLRRQKLKPRVMQAVEILFALPDLCNELVVGYLSYNDFLSLLEALRFEFSCDLREEMPDCEQSDDSDSIFEAIGQLFM